MGRLIDGSWYTDDDAQRLSDSGRYDRPPTRFHGQLEVPETGRYHLWVAHNCSWSQRLLIARNLLGLQDVITTSVAHYRRDDHGWWFRDGIDDLAPAEPGQRLHLWRIYTAADAHYSGRATVPVVWDRQRRTIVNNESALCLRMLAGFAQTQVQLVPDALRERIDALNTWVYDDINNGVYKAGFASTQEAYDEAYDALFAALDRCEDLLGRHRYLAGDQLTEADVRLFPTLCRFDPVYHGHFKCNRQKLTEFPNLWAYARDLYQTPGIGETVETEIYKLGYYGNSQSLNPRGIIPKGPDVDWDAPHGRA